MENQIDATRLFVLSDSPPERDVQWTTGGVEGSWRFINRVWAEIDNLPEAGIAAGDEKAALELRKAAHKAAKFVTEALDGFRFNSASASSGVKWEVIIPIITPTERSFRVMARVSRP